MEVPISQNLPLEKAPVGGSLETGRRQLASQQWQQASESLTPVVAACAANSGPDCQEAHLLKGTAEARQGNLAQAFLLLESAQAHTPAVTEFEKEVAQERRQVEQGLRQWWSQSTADSRLIVGMEEVPVPGLRRTNVRLFIDTRELPLADDVAGAQLYMGAVPAGEHVVSVEVIYQPADGGEPIGSRASRLFRTEKDKVLSVQVRSGDVYNTDTLSLKLEEARTPVATK